MFHTSHIRKSTARAGGHTLIELMVVMVLITIAASLVLPIAARSYSGFKLRLAADSIVRLMQRAKSRSIFEGRTYLLIFPSATARDREIVVVREDGVQLDHYTLPVDTSLTSRTEDGDWSTEIGALAFYPDGTSEGALLSLGNASRSVLHIQLDPLRAKALVVAASEAEP